ILVLTVGLLGLVTSAALVTRMIGRGQHSAVAAQYAQRRLEMLRITGCKAQASGTEVWTRGATPVDSVSCHSTRWDLANQTAERRELDAADGDLKAMTATSVRIRAMRELAFVCTDPVLGGGLGQITLTVRQTPIYGTRQTFSKGDSILVYWEGNPTTRADDQW